MVCRSQDCSVWSITTLLKTRNCWSGKWESPCVCCQLEVYHRKYLFQDWDGILNVWWSPDKKRILMRAFCSGGQQQLRPIAVRRAGQQEVLRRAKKGAKSQMDRSTGGALLESDATPPWIKYPLKRNDGYDPPPERETVSDMALSIIHFALIPHEEKSHKH